MRSQTISCKNCKNPLPATIYNKSTQICPTCKTQTEVYIFPAFFRTQPTHSVKSSADEDEAGCYYHPGKKAVIICDNCGRFLCSLCDIELNSRHLCPSCVEKGKQRQKIKTLETSCILYDSIALSVAFVPLLFFIFLFWATVITAPMAIFIAMRYWNSSCSVLRRTKLRFVLAIILAVLQIGGWIAVLILFL